MDFLIFLIVVVVVGYLVYKEYSKSKKAKQEMFNNAKPGYLSIYRGYSEKSRDIKIVVNGVEAGVLEIDSTRALSIKIDEPCTVTTTKPGKFKSSIEITKEELGKPMYAKVVASKYSNDIVKIKS